MATRKSNTAELYKDFDAIPAETRREVKSKNPEPESVYFGELLSDIGTMAENLDAFTQARLLTDIGKSIISSIGWNRAFLESIYYESAERALGLQGTPKDEAGFFIGYEPSEKPTNVNGRIITSVYDRLSQKQMDLVDDCEDKETLMWDVYDTAERAWRTLTGEVDTMVKPSNKQRQAGIKPGDLEALAEDAKRGALTWKVNGSEEEQRKRKEKQAEVIEFKHAQRAAARAARIRTR